MPSRPDSRPGSGGGHAGADSVRDDIVLPFRTERSGIVGRLVRLGRSVHTVLAQHDYPQCVAEALGQSLALTAMLGSGLKFDGRLILQTKSDGPLGMLVAHYEQPGRVRGYAGFDPERLAKLQAVGAVSQPDLLGQGHLAMTIDPGGHMDRYQGIVSLDHMSLGDAAHVYFRQSEQLPTFLRLAVAQLHSAGDSTWAWRAGGIMVQSVPPEGGHVRSEADETNEALAGEDDDHWRRVEMLARTVEDHELTDPTLAPEDLLFRLFHEEGVRVYPPIPLETYCNCSRERVGGLLTSFGGDGIEDMREPDGAITVTCEFCNTKYRFEDKEFGTTD